MSEQVVVEGIVENIIFQNNINGYTVFSVSPFNQSVNEILCVGNIPYLSQGESIKITGIYVVHPVYGKQINVEHFEKTIPTSEHGLIKYLGSGIIKGIRERLAKRIVDHFGRDTFSIIENYPEHLTEIKGISMSKALSISATFHEQTEMRKVILFLQDFGISIIYAMKIYKRYKQNTFDVIKTNPYSLADEVFGIGFKTADSIAFKAGIQFDSPYRIQAGIKYSLQQASVNGHVYLPKKLLIGYVAELLEISTELIENNILTLQMERVIFQESIDDNDVVYLSSFYYCENNVAKKLLELSSNAISCKINVESKISEIENETGVKLAENQKQAVIEAMDNGVLIITGGPGTGKTTTINTIINILRQEKFEIQLAAPTGRAAKRMSEATGIEAKTLHRLLEITFLDGNNGRRQSFGKDKDNPIESDVIIVDESSMVDILLMNSLLTAIAPGTRLILVGDVDQLPSVGPGNVLKDIISSGKIKIVRLNEIFRQARESAIVMNAHRINKGKYPVLNEKNKDFFFTKKSNIDEVINTILELTLKRLPKYTNCDSFQDIQILTPMRKSLLGVSNLNKILQEKINPPSNEKKEKEFRNIIFREGDKVMQIKNNYNMPWRVINRFGKVIDEGLGVFNGDTGILKTINDYDETMTIIFDENKLVEYDFSQIDELELCYAITIHKSQGSEYKVVVIPIHSGAPMLMSRNLLYTAVTRAKELVVIVGIPETLYRMVDNNKEVNRYSSLNRRIIKMFDMG